MMPFFENLTKSYKLEFADLLFVLSVITILYTNWEFIDTLEQIPSPIYGGDYYNGLGGVMHLVEGGSLFESAQMRGEIPWVPWLYHLLVSLFSIISGIDPMNALLFFSLITQFFSLIVVYAFIQYLLKDKYISLIGVMLSTRFFPVFKYTDFSTALIMPAFLFFLYLFLERQSLKRSVFAGIFLGLAGLSNTQAFFLGFLILGFSALLYIGKKAISFKEKISFHLDEGTLSSVRLFAIVFVFGFLISLLFWYWPIFVYKGKTLNPIQDITSPDMREPSVLWDSIFGIFLSFVLPYQSDLWILFTLFNLVGIGYVFLNLKKDNVSLFLLTLFIVFVFSALHPLLTLPIFDFHLMNFMMTDRLGILSILLVSYGIHALIQKFANQRTLILAFLLLLAFSYFFDVFEGKKSDPWVSVGEVSLDEPYVELQQWILDNTNVNDVFITTNEDGFMMNALTGRKSVSYRRTHTSPYTDMDKRMADQAVIVYGNNPDKIEELLDKYNVTYLLWTDRWLYNEFNIDESGYVVGFFDPLAVADSELYRYYWETNGVVYSSFEIPLDPAPRENVPTYDVLVAFPSNASVDTPYSNLLLNYFTLKKVISYQGYEYFRIYERT